MILSGQRIRVLGIVSPCEERNVVDGMTFGLGPASYDCRIRLSSDATKAVIEPRGLLLVTTMEEIRIPAHVCGFVYNKSTWARAGLECFGSVLQPGWRGFLTVELINHSRVPVILKNGQPLCQLVFHFLDELAEHPYDGVYQDQIGIPVGARLHEEQTAKR